MTVMAIMPVRSMNLVSPLAHEATDMHVEAATLSDTAGSCQAASGAAMPMIDADLRRPGVNSEMKRRTRRTTPGPRTSKTATRTPSTRTTTTCSSGPSADSSDVPTLEEVVVAYLMCRQHKRSTAAALAFEIELEQNLCKLHDELVTGEYRPGRSICFVNMRPRPREVWAASFTDRIVHHLLFNRIAQRFLRSFIYDNCACIPGRGTHFAADRAEHHVRSVSRNWSRHAFFLKCDIWNFFVSISKPVLFEQLATRIHEPFWLALTRTILFHDPRTNYEMRCSAQKLSLVPAHKSLFNAPDDTGLAIGNHDNQFFASVHLNALDQFAKHQIRARHYARYVDDVLIVHESPEFLSNALARIKAFLPAELGHRLNDDKTILQPVARGVDFVGHKIKPWHTVMRRSTLHGAFDRLESSPHAEALPMGNSLFGLLRQASHSHADRERLGKFLRFRGCTIDAAFTKTIGTHYVS